MSATEEEAKATESQPAQGPTKWIPKRFNYRSIRRQVIAKVEPCGPRDHPLHATFRVTDAGQPPTESKIIDEDDPLMNDFSDPLAPGAPATTIGLVGGFNDPLRSSTLDPLRAFAAHSSLDIDMAMPGQEDRRKKFIGWKTKRAKILKKYTSNKRIGVTAAFLDEEGGDGGPQTEKDHVEERVRKLEADAGDAKTEEAVLFMNQTDYIKKMEDNVVRLRRAWTEGKRVLALKLAIQSAKLLGETSVTSCPQFYPSMYVLVADILDSFGELVFERLKSKSSENHPLRENFTNVDANLDSKETCMNWFYKIACIRELLPRLLIELSLFGCWRFLKPQEEFPMIMRRLSRIIRGVGDPLVAAYCRAYLIHVAFKTCGELIKPILLEAFDDFLFTFNEIDQLKFKNIEVVERGKISQDQYIDLFTPCLDWIVQCIGYEATEEEFFGLLQRYRDGWNNSVVLLHIISQFEDSYISKHSRMITHLSKEAVVTTIPRSKLYREFGQSIVNVAPPEEERLGILNDVWKVVTKIEDSSQYVEVATVFVEYLLQHFNIKQVDTLLKDVLKHVRKDAAYKQLQSELHTVVSKILQYVKDFRQLFDMKNFLPIIDLLEKSNKMSACKLILEAFKRYTTREKGISDAVMINSLFDVSRMLHDSIDSLTFADERRQVSELIINFIDHIDFGHDLEKQLLNYVEFRGAFSNLDSVMYCLVVNVANLGMKAHAFMNGKHSKKTAAFVKACLAYCHITIPSLEDIWPRMYLFLTCGQVALVNLMIVQAEAFLEAAISLIPLLPATHTTDSNAVESTGSLLVEYVSTFSSVLLLLPGHPEKGPFYLANALIEGMEQYEPWMKPDANKVRAQISVFVLLCTYAQSSFPYHVNGVSSNDQMYGGTQSYMASLNAILSDLLDKILSEIASLKESPSSLARQASGTLSLDFVTVLLLRLTPNKHVCKLVVNLLTLSREAPNADTKYYNSTVRKLQQMSSEDSWYGEILQKLAQQQEK